MKAADLDINIINQYFDLLKNLSKQNKEKLISKLKDSMNSEMDNKKESINYLFGALSGTQAEEMIREINNSRTFNRRIENFE